MAISRPADTRAASSTMPQDTLNRSGGDVMKQVEVMDSMRRNTVYSTRLVCFCFDESAHECSNPNVLCIEELLTSLHISVVVADEVASGLLCLAHSLCAHNLH